MRLGVRFLKDVADANAFSYTADPPTYYEGDDQVIYFQLVDENTAALGTALAPIFQTGLGGGGATLTSGAARRYMPAAGATLRLILDSIEATRQVTRLAAQPFALDPSIWRLDVASSDVMRGTVDCQLRLAEGAIVHNASIKGFLRVLSTQRI